jgi:hypothetical protein
MQHEFVALNLVSSHITARMLRLHWLVADVRVSRSVMLMSDVKCSEIYWQRDAHDLMIIPGPHVFKSACRGGAEVSACQLQDNVTLYFEAARRAKNCGHQLDH